VSRVLRGAAVGLMVLAPGLPVAAPAVRPSAPKAAPRTYSREEAATTVRLLADYYRINLLELHTAYVTDGKPPSATVLKRVFPAMEARGWPRTRWLAVNGQPVNPDNKPRDAFETAAARAVHHGAELYERVEGRTYRAALPFSGACLKCHWGDKPHDYVGGIAFVLPLKGAGVAAKSTSGKRSN
jgi:hypothetical protein